MSLLYRNVRNPRFLFQTKTSNFWQNVAKNKNTQEQEGCSDSMPTTISCHVCTGTLSCHPIFAPATAPTEIWIVVTYTTGYTHVILIQSKTRSTPYSWENNLYILTYGTLLFNSHLRHGLQYILNIWNKVSYWCIDTY